MKQKPFAVSAIISNKKGQVLCVSRKDNHNDFGLPGGKLDPGETPEEAIVREIKEETGLKVSKNDLEEIFIAPCLVNETESKINVCYIVLKYRGKPKQMEAGLVEWYSFSKLLEPQCSFREYNSKVLDTLLKYYLNFY